MGKPVTIIIPTSCETQRSQQLFRAIDSIKNQKDVLAKILVIVNGNRFDQKLLESLRARTDISVYYLIEASAPKACAYGRQLVDTPFFGFLDDDDELLEHALIVRIRAMENDPSIDLVVTNGFDIIRTKREIKVNNCENINRAPLLELTKSNWLASCAGLFRSASIGTEYFSDSIDYNEWTLLAFKVALKCKVFFIDEPTYLINDTPGSLSKTSAFALSEEKVIQRMISLNPPPKVRRALEMKFARFLHSKSLSYLHKSQIGVAWRCHIRSLAHPGGLKYLAFTRKFLFPWTLKRNLNAGKMGR